ncbi:MAG: TolC family protein [Chitinophagaceae bacterium]|nr:TolC family protein [Chitinophagaceae bacterium]
MKKLFIPWILCFLFQDTQANDSAKVLSLEGFLQIVKQYHPVAKQAGIQVELAKAGLTASRGGFDPLLGIGGQNKTFDGINYYRGNEVQLNIPTWYGIELRAGLEYLGGLRTDPNETLGQTSFAGISVPLGKNLLMDKRRAALQKARIMMKASEQEKRVMLNDLMMESVETYWQWVEASLVYQAYQDVIVLNRKRLDWVKAAWRNGERPAIDTTEALVQLQQFEYQQNEANLKWQNAGVSLSAYLWTANNDAYTLPDDVRPLKKVTDLFDGVNFPEIEQLAEEAQKSHPELQLYTFKLNTLEVERKLKFQELLPKLDLKYNQLGKGYNIVSTATRSWFDNNYQYGVNFSIPLRLSQGRGEYRMARLKITETRLEQSNKKVLVVNKVRNYYNQLVNYKSQVSLLQRTYANYLRLQRGEETRFFNGESNLFLVNSRENKTIETMIKMTEVAVKYNKAAQALQWAAGILWR